MVRVHKMANIFKRCSTLQIHRLTKYNSMVLLTFCNYTKGHTDVPETIVYLISGTLVLLEYRQHFNGFNYWVVDSNVLKGVTSLYFLALRILP